MTADVPRTTSPPLRSKACTLMADLLFRELGMVLTIEEIDGLFTRQWSRLSAIGHAIHEGVPEKSS